MTVWKLSAYLLFWQASLASAWQTSAVDSSAPCLRYRSIVVHLWTSAGNTVAIEEQDHTCSDKTCNGRPGHFSFQEIQKVWAGSIYLFFVNYFLKDIVCKVLSGTKYQCCFSSYVPDTCIEGCTFIRESLVCKCRRFFNPSKFSYPNVLLKMTKQKYLICLV